MRLDQILPSAARRIDAGPAARADAHDATARLAANGKRCSAEFETRACREAVDRAASRGPRGAPRYSIRMLVMQGSKRNADRRRPSSWR
ncbi:hypothetical protein, partial [Burkholderia thailandensis]|uniref:hypothetical protein n=1 Tax=Burkholderia thailandensis TaxID=57975 RepID=UPI001CA4E4BF